MGDLESLASKLDAFMQTMAGRQQALEEQMEILTHHICKSGKELGGNGTGGASSGNQGSRGCSEERIDGWSASALRTHLDG
ncbi:conserved hypothetical protein [Ricinus communis]|uniref:Uncharacterized protein n=1 Tax=Ricinus communis TaxID=3988 RepID=B9RL02_RICCO|nr:conserved hypothetical protein [Ricinus communis]